MNLGRYQTLEILGTGSMGTVYRAWDTIAQRYVALKTIQHGVDPEPEIRERFYREALACAQLKHPAIIAVYDLGESDDVAYIAMELLRGSDFRQLITQRANLSLSVKVNAMAQVCEGLAHAHRGGILHRDVKPSNLFLVEGRDAKLLDFGMARVPDSKLTWAGSPLGTPNYMAPEQILGIATDERCDLFSAATVFFEFLVYTHPFQGDSIPRRIVHGESLSLLGLDSTLPASLQKILLKGLSKQPSDRFRTGDEFAMALRSVLAQQAPTEVMTAPMLSVPRMDASSGSVPAAERKPCRYCGVSNRAAAQYCIQCGGRLTPPTASLPALVLPPEITASPATPPAVPAPAARASAAAAPQQSMKSPAPASPRPPSPTVAKPAAVPVAGQGRGAAGGKGAASTKSPELSDPLMATAIGRAASGQPKAPAASRTSSKPLVAPAAVYGKGTTPGGSRKPRWASIPRAVLVGGIAIAVAAVLVILWTLLSAPTARP